MITLENVSKVFQTKKENVLGVDDVSLTVAKGEVYGIVGYSGAGKSTLIRLINLLERPSSGKVIVDGVNLLDLKNKDLRTVRQSIGMIFQGFHLVASKTVFDNVAFALKAAGVPKDKARTRVLELLDLVGLQDKIDSYPSQLSGGQKQRVSIARALANNPKVLLCDEATSALDPSTTKSILRLLKDINKQLGITIVIITHEMEVVKEICHRCAVMQDGRIIEQGNAYEIFANPAEDLTKTFIASVLQFELPEKLLESCTGTLLKLQFRGGTAGESIVSDLLQSIKVRGNILHGKIEYIRETPLGIFIFELQGDQQDVAQAIEFLKQRQIQVEVIQHGNHTTNH